VEEATFKKKSISRLIATRDQKIVEKNELLSDITGESITQKPRALVKRELKCYLWKNVNAVAHEMTSGYPQKH